MRGESYASKRTSISLPGVSLILDTVEWIHQHICEIIDKKVLTLVAAKSHKLHQIINLASNLDLR
jgi:hypothetical protein